MLEVKYQSPRFEKMSEADLSKWVKVLLLKLTVITGWTIPSNDALYAVLLDQFQKHISEQYSELNPDEIEHAFRTRGTTVEDWGKQMNLNLIDKILLPYLHDRYQLSATEEKLNYVDDGFCDQSAKNWWREQVEKAYQTYLANDKPSIYWFMYELLEEDGLIEKNFYKARLSVLQGKPDYAGDFEAARQAKIYCVKKYFMYSSANNYKNIYKPE